MDVTRADPHSTATTPPLGAAFWWLWTSSGLSNLADGILKIALPLVAIRYTDSPTVIAGLTVALTLPWLLFALPAGALADRHDRRRMMLGANTVRAALLLALALSLLLDAGSIWVLYAVAFCIGVSETVYDTSAQSILPQLVPRAALARANGRLHAAELTAQQFVGPPLGGFLVAAGAVLAFAAPTGLWVLAVGVLLLARGRFRVEQDRPSTMRADIAEGLRYLWRHRLLRRLAVMVGGFNLASNAVFAVFVLYAVGPTSAMGLTEPGFGVLLTTIAAGSLLGALLAERVELAVGPARSLLLAMPLGALTFGAPAVTADRFAIGATFLVGGAAIAVWNVVTISLRQRAVPARLLGRVNSGYRLVAWGSMPLGAALGGLLAEIIGLRAVFATMAVLALALMLLMKGITDEAIEAATQDGDQAA